MWKNLRISNSVKTTSVSVRPVHNSCCKRSKFPKLPTGIPSWMEELKDLLVMTLIMSAITELPFCFIYIFIASILFTQHSLSNHSHSHSFESLLFQRRWINMRGRSCHQTKDKSICVQKVKNSSDTILKNPFADHHNSKEDKSRVAICWDSCAQSSLGRKDNTSSICPNIPSRYLICLNISEYILKKLPAYIQIYLDI